MHFLHLISPVFCSFSVEDLLTQHKFEGVNVMNRRWRARIRRTPVRGLDHYIFQYASDPREDSLENPLISLTLFSQFLLRMLCRKVVSGDQEPAISE